MKEPKIQTRTFQYGNEKESEWPPKYGTGESGSFYWDPETRKFIKGHPPLKIKQYGQAPYIITDEMQPYYHPKAQMVVDSKSRLRQIDEALGTITTDRYQSPDPSWQKEQERIRRADAKEALHKSVAQVDAGCAPLSEETRAKCAITNDIVSKALGIDAFNAVGVINDPRGKRYKQKHRKRSSRK